MFMNHFAKLVWSITTHYSCSYLSNDIDLSYTYTEYNSEADVLVSFTENGYN